jgi:sec-independent protein translocase protein TatB
VIEGGEWIVIFLVALVVFGPERLPDLARQAGGWLRELRGAAREMRDGLEELSDPVAEVKRAVQDTVRLAAESDPRGPNGKLRWEGPKPVSGPTPADAMADLERIEASGAAMTDESEAEGIPPQKGEV